MNGQHQHMPEVHLHFHDAPSEQQHNEVMGAIANLRNHMDQRLQDVIDKQEEIKAETGQYIADRDELDRQKDAIAAQKDATIADLAAKLAANQITIAEFNDGLDLAKTKAGEAADLLPPVRPPVSIPVVLGSSYADRAAFDAALATDTGAGAVTLDAAEVKVATDSAADARAYFTHSVDGHIDTTGPTD